MDLFVWTFIAAYGVVLAIGALVIGHAAKHDKGDSTTDAIPLDALMRMFDER